MLTDGELFLEEIKKNYRDGVHQTINIGVETKEEFEGLYTSLSAFVRLGGNQPMFQMYSEEKRRYLVLIDNNPLWGFSLKMANDEWDGDETFQDLLEILC